MKSVAHLSEAEILEAVGLAELATAIYTSPNLVIETANPAMLAFWGKDISVIGKTIEEALPEIKGQEFPELLKQVWHTGITYHAKSAKAILRVNGELKTSYFDFTYLAVKDRQGKMKCILNTATDVTSSVLGAMREKSLSSEVTKITDELVQSNKKLIETVWQLSTKNAALKLSEHKLLLVAEELEERVKRRTRELEESNHELAAINEELHSSNETLNASEQALRVTFNRLAESEKMMETALVQAELGTWYVDARTGEFNSSPRLREIFGFSPSSEVLASDLMMVIREDYREKVQTAVNLARDRKETYHMDYPVITQGTGETRWVRATGRLYENDVSLPHHFSGTAQDITAQKTAEQRRLDFIGMVSHDLRSPLSSLGVFLHLLKAKAEQRQEEQEIETIGMSIRQVKRMGDMIGEFLEVARTDSGQIFLNSCSFGLHALLEESVSEARKGHPSARISYLCGGGITVVADYNKIGVVMTNLIGNAVKYSSGEPVVDISCIVLNTEIWVCVRDEGIGISAEELPRLFDRYYRVEGGKSIPGFGIGLYLCEGIIRRHGGRIWAESTPGKGSRFYFSLPR